MLIVLLQISKYLSHVVVILAAYSKTFDTIVIIVFYYFVRLDRVTEVILVEYNQLLLLILFDNKVELWISATIWYPCISNFQKYIYFVCTFFDLPQGSLHMSRKPVDMIFEIFDHIHLFRLINI